MSIAHDLDKLADWLDDQAQDQTVASTEYHAKADELRSIAERVREKRESIECAKFVFTKIVPTLPD